MNTICLADNNPGLCDHSRRHGKLIVSSSFIGSYQAHAALEMLNARILLAEFDVERDCLVITCICEQCDELGEAEAVPEYDIVIDVESTGYVSDARVVRR